MTVPDPPVIEVRGRIRFHSRSARRSHFVDHVLEAPEEALEAELERYGITLSLLAQADDELEAGRPGIALEACERAYELLGSATIEGLCERSENHLHAADDVDGRSLRRLTVVGLSDTNLMVVAKSDVSEGAARPYVLATTFRFRSEMRPEARDRALRERIRNLRMTDGLRIVVRHGL